MAASTYNITLEQFANFQVTFTYEVNGAPVDLTGYTLEMKGQSISGTALDWSSYLTNGTTAGTITVNIPGSVTAGYTPGSNASPVKYDLLITSPGGVKTRLVQGSVTISPGISS